MPKQPTSIPEPVPFPWLGDLLVAARKEQGITQTELAERIGSHQTVVARWEGGKYRFAEVGTILAIAHALGLELLVTAIPREADPKSR